MGVLAPPRMKISSGILHSTINIGILHTKSNAASFTPKIKQEKGRKGEIFVLVFFLLHSARHSRPCEAPNDRITRLTRTQRPPDVSGTLPSGDCSSDRLIHGKRLPFQAECLQHQGC